jgi:hypothetical protein
VSSSGQKRALEQPSDRSFDRSPHFVPTVTTRGVSAQRSHDAIQRESDRSLPANSGLAHPTVARCCRSLRKSLHRTEARAGIEPANSGFAVLSELLRLFASLCIPLRRRASRASVFASPCILLRALAAVRAQNRAHVGDPPSYRVHVQPLATAVGAASRAARRLSRYIELRDNRQDNRQGVDSSRTAGLTTVLVSSTPD